MLLVSSIYLPEQTNAKAGDTIRISLEKKQIFTYTLEKDVSISSVRVYQLQESDMASPFPGYVIMLG